MLTKETLIEEFKKGVLRHVYPDTQDEIISAILSKLIQALTDVAGEGRELNKEEPEEYYFNRGINQKRQEILDLIKRFK